MLAPIVLFAYNRPDHLKKTVEALAQNPEAKESILYIFCDGAKVLSIDNSATEAERERINKKNNDTLITVKKVRDYVTEIKGGSLFKEVIVTESDKNKGLAASVISGVDSVIRKYGKVIVVEDDAVSSPRFLEFMNKGLISFENRNREIWFLGGYCPNLQIPNDYKKCYYVTGRGSSYAWATWLDRWEKIDWDVKSYKKFRFNFKKRREFNEYGDDRSNMLDSQMRGKVNSWAVRFSYEMFRNNMYAVLPTKSLIKTIGRDGSGTHGKSVNHDFDVEFGVFPGEFVFDEIKLDERIIKQHTKYFKRSKGYLLKQYLKNVIFKV